MSEHCELCGQRTYDEEHGRDGTRMRRARSQKYGDWCGHDGACKVIQQQAERIQKLEAEVEENRHWFGVAVDRAERIRELEAFLIESLCDCHDEYGDLYKIPCERCVLITKLGLGAPVSDHPGLKQQEGGGE